MSWEPGSIPDTYVHTPQQFHDARGTFLEIFQATAARAATGRSLTLAQASTSVSDVGVVRGIHYARLPPSQAKYVFCPVGAVWDVVVDVRVGSPTFGTWQATLLDDVDRRAVFISEGLGHAFVSLAPGSVLVYLCSTPYTPAREHDIDPFDPAIGIDWPTLDREGAPLTWVTSDKDRAAASLESTRVQGLLPDYAEVRAFLDDADGRRR